jgi:hypothetical protein
MLPIAQVPVVVVTWSVVLAAMDDVSAKANAPSQHKAPVMVAAA